MGAFLGLTQPVGRAPLDDLDLVVDPVGDEGVQAQRARHPSTRASMFAPNVSCSWVCLYNCESTTRGWASRLRTTTRRCPVRLEESSRRSAMPVTLPASASSAIFAVRGVGVDLVRQFGDDQAGAPALVLLDVHDTAHDDRAAACAIRAVPPDRPTMSSAGGKVRTLDPLDECLEQFLFVASGCSSAH